jgi:hypothetical protein
MKHQTITAGHEWQDQRSGERQDDFHDVCIVCEAINPPEEQECPGPKEVNNDRKDES